MKAFRKLKPWLPAVLMGMALYGCGGSDSNGVDPTTPGEEPGQEAELTIDPYYNVCRGVDARCYNNWGAFDSVADTVLVYSRTAGPRHANLGSPMGPGLNPEMNADNRMQAGLVRMLEEAGIKADWTEDVSVLSSRINRYKAVIFASSNRDTLWDASVNSSNDASRTALRNYMRRGGGFVGLHNAFGAEYNWPYYEGLLGNANFYNHGPNRNGDVQIIAQDPSTEGIDVRFAFQDEWYNLAPFPTNVKFLATVDTDTLNPLTASPHPGHPGFHPVAWCQYYDGGRAWLTTLGHNSHSFDANSEGVGAAQFQKLVIQGVKSAMGLTDFCTP
ncbi:ThuA domain-containing protein [Lampropedia puyangensis]|uniref:ThuA domain-containing protein n=1 Tax=Lampropedia puyangensis TaxID=1330072 RepID=A0A4S8F9Y8_9BURK|nr:ThuA domain-containing protein [Lampropedia puyangensis]THU04039.1 ThuA domain-containing protein [Lampropedia puyangensis]